MIQLRETARTIPFYRPVPLTNLPLIYHREHLFPYTSYGDTEATPVPRAFRMVVLENDALRVEVAPELVGGFTVCSTNESERKFSSAIRW